MPMRLPVSTKVEYRGVQQPSEFVNAAGELIAVAAKPKFEYATEEGDVALLALSGGQLDKCNPPVDYASFTKGETFHLEGVVVLQDRGSGRDSYFSVVSLVPDRVKAASS